MAYPHVTDNPGPTTTAFLERVFGNDRSHVEWMSPIDETGRFDHNYVTMIVGLRWTILIAYVLLGVSGLLPMHPLALAGSGLWIGLTNVLASWYWAQRRPVRWYDASYLSLDLLSVVFATLAAANMLYPVWIALVMLMIQAVAERPTRFAIVFNSACVATYPTCAAVLAAMGWYQVNLGIAAVTVTILALVAINLLITFDGNRRLRATIRRMAVTDSLTGLANRRQLSHFLAEPPGDTRLAVIVMDIDQFKEYNDGYGHLAGDNLLVQLAEVLRQAFPDASMISRYGGDEFVVLLTVRTMEEAEARVRYLGKLAREADSPVSVGVALWPDDHPTLDAAFAAADDCLRAAKRAKRGSFASWSDGRITLGA